MALTPQSLEGNITRRQIRSYTRLISIDGQAFLQSGENELCLIFEDDVLLSTRFSNALRSTVRKHFDRVSVTHGCECDLLLLGCFNATIQPQSHRVDKFEGTHAYVLTREAARRLVSIVESIKQQSPHILRERLIRSYVPRVLSLRRQVSSSHRLGVGAVESIERVAHLRSAARGDVGVPAAVPH